MDPRLHRVQGKAELVTDLLTLLQDFHREKLAMLLRHQSGAELVGQYDFNNTYQYIVNRDETQLSWVAKAIEELGGTISDQPAPDRGKPAKGAEHRILEEDERDAQLFVDRWRPRVDAMQNARHAKMLKLILGETLEQKRFFDQALAGRTDLLGRRGASLGPSHGEVLPSRWIE
jgi:hypothetical protein